MPNYFNEAMDMKSILVVDDDAAMQDIIKTALADKYNINLASNGNEACALLLQQAHDLVITDLVMPGMNGIDLLMEIQKTAPRQKIIAMSGGGGITGRFDYLPVAQLLGAEKILRKPFTLSELRTAVEKVLLDQDKACV